MAVFIICSFIVVWNFWPLAWLMIGLLYESTSYVISKRKKLFLSTKQGLKVLFGEVVYHVSGLWKL